MTSGGLYVGKLIDAQWRLERLVRTSATTALWEGEHVRLGGRVAVKFLLSAADETFAICQVRSPHIVQVLDRGEHEGNPYVVMELLEGEDLGQLLARERTLSLEETEKVVDQLCRALQRVHDAGLVHGRLEPDHIFVIHERDGGQYIKLLDFGAGTSTPSQRGVTRHYSSPEQLDGRELDSRSDVWSVAAIAFQVLVGAAPFGAESESVHRRIRSGQFDAERLHERTQRSLPRELDTFFKHAFQSRPNARFPSVSALSDALRAIAQTHGTVVAPRIELPPVPSTRSRSRSRSIDAFALTHDSPLWSARRFAWLMAVAVALLVVGLAIWWPLRAPDASKPAAATPQPSAASHAVAPTRAAAPAAGSIADTHTQQERAASPAPPPPVQVRPSKRPATTKVQTAPTQPAGVPKDWGF